MAATLEIKRRIADKYFDDKDIYNNLLGVVDGGLGMVDGMYLTRHMNDENSFIYQVTKNNVFMDSLTPLSVDEDGAVPTGETDATKSQIVITASHTGWYYYTFDWRNYQNVLGEDAEPYDFNGRLDVYFKKLALAAAPYAVQLWGKKFGDDVSIETWYNENIQFGGYTVEARSEPQPEPYPNKPDKEHLSQVNPGLTFLIGMKMKAVKELTERAPAGVVSMTDLVPARAIIIKLDSIDKELAKMAKTLNIYHDIREEFDTSFDISPISCDFEDEADLIKDFGSALKTLIKDSAEKGGGTPDGDPEHMSSSEIEDWAKHPEMWNQPENLIEVGITGDWQVSYVREYAPVTSFRPNLNLGGPGIEAVRTLGDVADNRIIGGGFSNSQKQMFASFKQESGVRDPRTVAFISSMHARNGFNEGIKTKFNLDPQKGTPVLSIFDFIKENVYKNSNVDWKSQDPEEYQTATAKFLEEHGGSIATPTQRALSGARSNNPSWAKQYEDYSQNWVIDQTDQFFASLPETTDRLRINEGPPYGLDEIWNNVLNQADVKRLTVELIKCVVDPQGWLELACRYAMKNLGADAWFERMQEDGTMDKLKKHAEIANQVSDSFNVIAKEKRVSQSNFDRLTKERNKYNDQTLQLLNKRKSVQAQLDNPSTPETQKASLRNEQRQINFEIEAAMGRRRQVELDSELAYANKSAGAWMPMTPEGANRAAEASQKLSGAIMDISDPEFKKQLCANIISYSIQAVQLLFDLYRTIEELFKDDEEGADPLEQENRPKAQTDDTAMYFVEMVRAMVAQALAATILFFVKKLLTELVESCRKLKSNLWEDLKEDDRRKNDKIPGKARYNDLLAQTPSKAARDLTAKLSGFFDVIDENIASDLLGLMEDLELLLSQLELCSLSEGTATIEVLKIVKNLLKIKYNNLYSNLQGKDDSLSFNKIKDFFRVFEPLIKSGYCEELQKPDAPLQLYQECPPYIKTLCGDLLNGHCTKEQIDNICKRARIDRLEKLTELIDFAYNPEKSNIPDPADPRSPNAVSQDIYPNNIMNDMLTDQNLRPAADAFKSEIFTFSNKLLHGSGTGFPIISPADLEAASKAHANASSADGGTDWNDKNKGYTDGIAAVLENKKKLILNDFKTSLYRPFKWTPREGTPLSFFKIEDKSGQLPYIGYVLLQNNMIPEFLEIKYYDGPLNFKDTRGMHYYPLKNGKLVPPAFAGGFSPAKRFESFTNIYARSAPTISKNPGPKSRLNLFPFENNPYIEWGNKDPDFDNKFYSSPRAMDFYSKLNEHWPAFMTFNDLKGSRKGIKFLFNILTKNIGNHVFKKISKSVIFKEQGRDKLELFFNSFFPQLAFDVDEQCDVKETSLLKSEKIKKYIRDRKNDLDKKEKQPDLNHETPNLARATAEASVMLMMRVYAFELALRMLPLLPVMNSKSLLTSEVLIDIMIEHMMYELAILDYNKVRKTPSTKQAKDLRDTRPVKGNMLDPSGGRLNYNISPSGEGRYVEEPPCPTPASEGGKPFEPRFQAHIVYYANNIMKGRAEKEKEKDKDLLDPITNEIYVEPVDDPYSLTGLTYLLREQMIEISDFFDREFDNLFDDIGMKSFDQFFLEIFLYKDIIKDNDAFGGHLIGDKEITYNPFEKHTFIDADGNEATLPPEAYMPSDLYGLTSDRWWSSPKNKGGEKFNLFNLMPSINTLNENEVKLYDPQQPDYSQQEQSYLDYIKSVLEDYEGTEKPKKALDTDISTAVNEGFLENLKSRVIMNQRFYELGMVSSYWQSEEMQDLYAEYSDLYKAYTGTKVSAPFDGEEWDDYVQQGAEYMKKITSIFANEDNPLTDAEARMIDIVEQLVSLGIPVPINPDSGKYVISPHEFESPQYLGSESLPDPVQGITGEDWPQGQIIYALTKFAKEAKLKEGGFILEPYIRVKQHTPFGEFKVSENDVTQQQIKEQLAKQTYNDIIQYYYNNAEYLQNAEIAKKCALSDPENYQECAQDIVANWHSITQTAAQEAYDNVINNKTDLTVKPSELDERFGDLSKTGGAHINIAHWLNYMSGKGQNTGNSAVEEPGSTLDPLKLNLNSERASRPHTDWFDQWVYGLRLVYVAPLKTNIGIENFSSDETKACQMERDDIMKGFYDYIGVESYADDPWNIKNKKTYILHERINLATLYQNKFYYQLLNEQVISNDYSSKNTQLEEQATGIASPPIFCVPLIESELPVGSLTSDEKLYASKVAQDEAYNQAILKGETPNDAEEAAKQAGKDLFKELSSIVPLNYFTYQDWGNTQDPNIETINDYPLEQLLCQMIQTKGFEDLFIKMFPLENYKTLLGTHLLLESFDLNEGTAPNKVKPYDGDYFSLFESTKGALRFVFYTNTLAHDPHTVIPMSSEEIVQAQQHEEADFWAQFAALLLGNPANYASIFAMTPISVLKVLVSVIDPKWTSFPWTVPGLVMFLLNNMAGPLSGTWFSDNFDGKKDTRSKALVCPEEFKAKTLEDLTKEELSFVEMMKSFGINEEDRNFIITAKYNTAPVGIPLNTFSFEHTNGETLYFKDTELFKTLSNAWETKKDDELMKLGVLFNNLKEYYDTLIEVYQHHEYHCKYYMGHAFTVMEEYFTPHGHWIAETNFEELLFVDCADSQHPRYSSYGNVKHICDRIPQFQSSIKQLNTLETLFNTFLSQIDLSISQTSLKLTSPTEMTIIPDTGPPEIPLLQNIAFLANVYGPTSPGGSIFIPDTEKLSAEELSDLLNNSDGEENLIGSAIPSTYLPLTQLAEKISSVITTLVWSNDKVFAPGTDGLMMSTQAHSHWNPATHVSGAPVNFNAVGGHDLRSFWFSPDWDIIMKKGAIAGTWPFQLGSHGGQTSYTGGAFDVGTSIEMHLANEGKMKTQLFPAVDNYGPMGPAVLEEFHNHWSNEKYGFSYANSFVGHHIDALTHSPDDDHGPVDPSLGSAWTYPDVDPLDLITAFKDNWEKYKYVGTAVTFQDIIQKHSPSTVKFYDMYNINHHNHIAKYWTTPWYKPWVVKNRITPTPNYHHYKAWGGQPVPQYFWEFADLRHEKWNYQPTDVTDIVFPGQLQPQQMVLDHIAWYYPELAAVIAELLYKMYNIKLKTTCINVYEIKDGTYPGRYKYEISIKHMPSNESLSAKAGAGYSHEQRQPKVTPFPKVLQTINKKIFRLNLNSKFVL